MQGETVLQVDYNFYSLQPIYMVGQIHKKDTESDFGAETQMEVSERGNTSVLCSTNFSPYKANSYTKPVLSPRGSYSSTYGLNIVIPVDARTKQPWGSIDAPVHVA